MNFSKTVVAVVLLAGLAGCRPSAPIAAPSPTPRPTHSWPAGVPSPGPPSRTPPPITGLSAAKVTATWKARWKTEPRLVRHERPDSDQWVMKAGDLLFTALRSPQVPDQIWSVSCSTKGSAMFEELLDHCLKGAAGHVEYDEVRAWIGSVPRVGDDTVRHQFPGFTAALRAFSDGGKTLYLGGGTLTV